MGMDVIGKNPTSKTGRVFLNNNSWWCELAEYVISVAPEITSNCEKWYTNDGDGLSEADSIALATCLQAEIDSGRCAAYADRLRATNPAPEVIELVTPRGPLNVCVYDHAYRPFEVENVKEFVAFLRWCGGFEIW